MNKSNSVETQLPSGAAAFAASYPGAHTRKIYEPPAFDEAIKHPTVRAPVIQHGGYQPVATSTVKRNPIYSPEDTMA